MQIKQDMDESFNELKLEERLKFLKEQKEVEALEWNLFTHDYGTWLRIRQHQVCNAVFFDNCVQCFPFGMTENASNYLSCYNYYNYPSNNCTYSEANLINTPLYGFAYKYSPFYKESFTKTNAYEYKYEPASTPLNEDTSVSTTGSDLYSVKTKTDFETPSSCIHPGPNSHHTSIVVEPSKKRQTLAGSSTSK